MTDRMTCPWCRKEIRDLWDFAWDNDEEIETECPSCGEPIVLTRNITVHYDVHPVKETP